MFKNSYLVLTLIIAIITLSASCGGGGDKDAIDDTVVQHSLSDPKQLNPSNSTDNAATTMYTAVMQELLNIDYKTNEMIPLLAKELPTITELNDSMIQMSFEIRPEAKWDNGEPITGHDVAFNVKLMKIPAIDNGPKKPYFEFIKEVKVDEANPKKFDMVCKKYFGAIYSMSDLHILPPYVYDPEGVLENYDLADLSYDETGKYADDETLNDYGVFFNSPKFMSEVVVGSGPYAFDRWDPNQRVVFVRKDNWWGEGLEDVNHWFEAYPQEIVFETINDLTTAVVALKGEKIDAMRSIPQKEFVTDLRKSDDFKSKYNTYTPPLFAYDYIGMNLRDPRFQDVRTRKAMAHIMNVDQLIETSLYGLGERTACFTHPSITKRLNPEVKPYEYNIEEAKTLLAAAGWADTDNDGILDMEIDGEKYKLEVSIKSNQGNSRRETAALIFKEEAEKAGVKVNVEIQQWGQMIDAIRKHNFDMYVAGWISSPLESDPKQIWHSESAKEGSNYVGYTSPEADALIETIRNSMDENVRNENYKKLHKVIHDDVPYIFLINQKERIAIHSRFDNAYGSGIKPGYWANGFISKGTIERVAN